MRSNITRQFCAAVIQYMEDGGVTRTALAKRLGTSRAYVTMVLNGNQNMTLKTIEKICSALNLNVTLVLAPKPPKKGRVGE